MLVCFLTFEMFCSTMDQCTNNFECLVIHNASKSNKLEDQVFWYKADAHPDFRCCSKEVWAYNDANYVPDDDSDDDQGTTVEEYINSRRKGPRINIKKI